MIRAIFCINPGRSGSHYLSGLLAEATNCESHHEAEPTGFGDPLYRFQRGDAGAMDAVAHAKVQDIADATARGLVYADTSHAFVKGFGWPLLKRLPPEEVGIVILKRDRAQVTESTAKVRCLPLNDVGRTYILTPGCHRPLAPPPRFAGLPGRAGFALAKGLHFAVQKRRGLGTRLGIKVRTEPPLLRYQMAALGWYWDETYALGARFQADFPGCRYFETSLEALNRPETVQDMYQAFELTGDPASARIGTATNLRPE